MSSAEDWVRRYVNAWRSNDPSDIGALFTDDAVYEYEPTADPILGREAIVRSWTDHPDAAGSWSFEWSIFLERPGLGIVTGTTSYVGRKTFDNVWILQLTEDGRASRFTEWFMERPPHASGEASRSR